MKSIMHILPCLLLMFLLFCCNSKESNAQGAADNMAHNMAESMVNSPLAGVMRNAQLPVPLSEKIMAAADAGSAFMDDVSICLAEDGHLWELVDKQHPLSSDYVPSNLVTLTDGAYQVNRSGLQLRRDAADSLRGMAAAARADGITLIASSAYRSFDYQEQVYNRVVREMGQEAADRESARPGHSQHQTGLAVDFGSIDDSFALSAAGRWMTDNASRFGWSLSFPDGYEEITGYRWESWHYRYVGKNIAAFINTYFDGIQQYALRFLYEYKNTGD